MVIEILSIEIAEVSVILVGLLIIGRGDWENIASRNDSDRLLNRLLNIKILAKSYISRLFGC